MSDTPEFAAEPQVDTSYTGQIATLKEQLAAAQQTIDRLRGLLSEFCDESMMGNVSAAEKCGMARVTCSLTVEYLKRVAVELNAAPTADAAPESNSLQSATPKNCPPHTARLLLDALK